VSTYANSRQWNGIKKHTTDCTKGQGKLQVIKNANLMLLLLFALSCSYFVCRFDFVMSFWRFLCLSFFMPFRRCLCQAFISCPFFCSFDTNRKWFMQNFSAQLIQNLPRLSQPTYTKFDCRTFFPSSHLSSYPDYTLGALPYWNFRSPDIGERHFVIYLGPFYIRNSELGSAGYRQREPSPFVVGRHTRGQSLTNCKRRN